MLRPLPGERVAPLIDAGPRCPPRGPGVEASRCHIALDATWENTRDIGFADLAGTVQEVAVMIGDADVPLRPSTRWARSLSSLRVVFSTRF